VGLAQYSDEVHQVFLLNQYLSKNDVLDQIGILPYRGGETHTGGALDFVSTKYFTESAGSRAKGYVPQLAILITSGESSDEVEQPAKKLRYRGISIYVVGIGIQNTTELQQIASKPFHKYLYSIGSFDDLPDLSTRLFLDTVCSSATVADIVFLVDESSKIGSKNFQLIRAFLLKIVNALDIDPSNVRIGLVLYSDEPRLEFTLDTFKDKLEILNYLKNLPYRGGQAYTGRAIEFLRNKVFTQEAGSRKKQGVQQIAVVITDGQSLDDYTEPASKLRRESVTVYAVGIQNITEGSRLDKIATYPPRNHVTTLKFFLQLSNIKWKIKKQLCNEIVTKTFVVPLKSQSLKEGKKYA
uniref:VWFA domain-containing protein n=1 Tax=Coturnix japonica TaxID=93934 RepID=A0A8C2SQX8_COTJA